MLHFFPIHFNLSIRFYTSVFVHVFTLSINLLNFGLIWWLFA